MFIFLNLLFRTTAVPCLQGRRRIANIFYYEFLKHFIKWKNKAEEEERGGCTLSLPFLPQKRSAIIREWLALRSIYLSYKKSKWLGVVILWSLNLDGWLNFNTWFYSNLAYAPNLSVRPLSRLFSISLSAILLLYFNSVMLCSKVKYMIIKLKGKLTSLLLYFTLILKKLNNF